MRVLTIINVNTPITSDFNRETFLKFGQSLNFLMRRGFKIPNSKVRDAPQGASPHLGIWNQEAENQNFREVFCALI